MIFFASKTLNLRSRARYAKWASTMLRPPALASWIQDRPSEALLGPGIACNIMLHAAEARQGAPEHGADGRGRAQSSLTIVPVAVAVMMVAPTGLDRVPVKVSLGSTVGSPTVNTLRVRLVVPTGRVNVTFTWAM